MRAGDEKSRQTNSEHHGFGNAGNSRSFGGIGFHYTNALLLINWNYIQVSPHIKLILSGLIKPSQFLGPQTS